MNALVAERSRSQRNRSPSFLKVECKPTQNNADGLDGWGDKQVEHLSSAVYLAFKSHHMNTTSFHRSLTFLALMLVVMICSCDSSQKNSEGNRPSNSSSQEDELMSRLRKKKVMQDYHMVGDLDQDVLAFDDCSVGDYEHFTFKDSRGAVLTFDLNSTNVELCTYDDDFGANRRYINKKFKVIWRDLKLDAHVDSEIMLMDEMKEILYLEEQ